MSAPDHTDQLYLIRAEARRVERSARILRQLAARAIDAEAANTSDSQEAHAHDKQHPDEE
jgi:hypothetical protein